MTVASGGEGNVEDEAGAGGRVQFVAGEKRTGGQRGVGGRVYRVQVV